MRIARILPGIAVLNGHVFVCGGEVDSQILANGEIYDPHEDTWCEMASMTIPRCEFGKWHTKCVPLQAAACIFINPLFHCRLYCRAVSITDNLCTKQENSLIFWSKI